MAPPRRNDPGALEREAGAEDVVHAAKPDTSSDSQKPVAAQEHIERVIEKVEVADITIGLRKRKVDAKVVKGIATSLAEVGQLHPITVRFRENQDGTRDILLVAGEGRLRAARSLGWSYINAYIVDTDNLGAEAIEIDKISSAATSRVTRESDIGGGARKFGNYSVCKVCPF